MTEHNITRCISAYQDQRNRQTVHATTFFSSDDDDENRSQALAYWQRHPALTVVTTGHHCYAVGPMALTEMGWDLTCPEELV